MKSRNLKLYLFLLFIAIGVAELFIFFWKLREPSSSFLGAPSNALLWGVLFLMEGITGYIVYREGFKEQTKWFVFKFYRWFMITTIALSAIGLSISLIAEEILYAKLSAGVIFLYLPIGYFGIKELKDKLSENSSNLLSPSSIS